MYFRLGKYAVT